MRKFLLFAIVAVVVALTATTVYAAPPDEPPGLEKAIAAQEAHNPKLLKTPGVVGTAVGLTKDGAAVVKIYTVSEGVTGLPKFLDGILVEVNVTGKMVALKGPPAGKDPKNRSPQVEIISPEDGALFPSGVQVTFTGTASDKEDGDLTDELAWFSSRDGPIGDGGSFDSTLTDGSHTITVEVTDTGGKTGDDSITITVGPVEEPDPTDMWPRPVPIGISTGNSNECAAGTIGARVRSRNKVFALSNNHVYARENMAVKREIVTQPGLYDTTCVYDPDNYLGRLSKFVRIKWGTYPFPSLSPTNYVDAAIASTTEDHLGKATPPSGYGTPNSTTVEAYIGMAVQKFGRTTGNTEGFVSGVNGVYWVEYDLGYALFADQIVIETTGFSDRGDSGSLIVTNDEDCNPIGLLFAGGENVTLANKIDRVLDALGVVVDGK